MQNNVTLFGQLPQNPLVDKLFAALLPVIQHRLPEYRSGSELSGGEKQLISILRALNMPYTILFLSRNMKK